MNEKQRQMKTWNFPWASYVPNDGGAFHLEGMNYRSYLEHKYGEVPKLRTQAALSEPMIGVTFKGTYTSYDELVAKAIHPVSGDTWFAGGEVYMWDGSWWNCISGPTGCQGVEGNIEHTVNDRHMNENERTVETLLRGSKSVRLVSELDERGRVIFSVEDDVSVPWKGISIAEPNPEYFPKVTKEPILLCTNILQ